MINLLITLAAGALAGYLAGRLMNTNFSLLMNMGLGIVGGIVGGFLFGLIGLTYSSIIGYVIVSSVGACAVIYLARRFLK